MYAYDIGDRHVRIVHLQLNDAKADVEGRLVQCASRVECGDDLLTCILTGAVAARVDTVSCDAHIHDLLRRRAALRRADVLLKAKGQETST